MARTALQTAQYAALRLGVDEPTVLFSSTDRTETELRRALIEAAEKILHAHDWAILKTIETHDGDGTTTEFALPDDYLRMPKNGHIWSTKWERAIPDITPEDWLDLDVRNYDVVQSVWTIYGGNIVYKPALDSDEDAKFFYISDKVCADSGGTAKAEFDSDDDTFRLDDRTLELMLVAQWRRQKSLDYQEELREANIALSRAIERDKGARIVTQRGRMFDEVQIAYPREVSE